MSERVLKVFVSSPDDLPEKYLPPLAEYDNFSLVVVKISEVKAFASLYPIEDITEQYDLVLNQKQVDTSRVRIDSTGQTCPHPAYRTSLLSSIHWADKDPMAQVDQTAGC